MSAIQSLYDARSPSTGSRSVVFFPRIVPPSATPRPLPPSRELFDVSEGLALSGHCDEVAQPLAEFRRAAAGRVDEADADADVFPRQRAERSRRGGIGADREGDIARHHEAAAQ